MPRLISVCDTFSREPPLKCLCCFQCLKRTRFSEPSTIREPWLQDGDNEEMLCDVGLRSGLPGPPAQCAAGSIITICTCGISSSCIVSPVNVVAPLDFRGQVQSHRCGVSIVIFLCLGAASPVSATSLERRKPRCAWYTPGSSVSRAEPPLQAHADISGGQRLSPESHEGTQRIAPQSPETDVEAWSSTS